MNARRGVLGSAIWAAAASCAAAFVVLDALALARGDAALSAASDAAKLACVALLALGVWTGGDGAGSPEDARRLSIAFAVAVAADLAFYLRWRPLGIAGFVAAQLLLAWRHGRGLEPFLREGTWRRHRAWLALTGLATVALFAGAGALLAPLAVRRGSRELLALGAIYAAALAASVGVAWLSPLLGALTRRRGAQAAAGMTLFFACDVTVALGALAADRPALVARALTWIFYAPALALLALSGRASRATQ